MSWDSERQDPGERGLLLAFAPPPRKGKYLAEPSKVVYRARDGTEEKVFDALVSSTGQALEWLVPPMAEVRYGHYSLAFRGISRGKRKETEDDGVPCILEADRSSKEYRKNWARLIQKIGACPRLDRGRSIPKAHAPPAGYLRDPFSQLPMNDDHLYRDPDYPWDAYLQS